jgi:hypothetical protein
VRLPWPRHDRLHVTPAYFHEFVTSLRRPDSFRPSDRWAGWDSHPREIADLDGGLSFRGTQIVPSKEWVGVTAGLLRTLVRFNREH